MAREIDIYITAKDGFSDAVKKMKESQQILSKGVDELNEDLKRLNENKVQLKVDFEKAKNELKSAQKAFRELGDEQSRNNLIDAQTNYDNTKRNLDLVTKSARQTQQQIEQTSGAFSKMENRAAVGGGEASMMNRLVSAGAIQMAGDIVSQGLSTYVGSAYGSEAGTYLGGALSGAASGAAIGSIIAPGIGTAIGAGVGTIAGVIQGGLQVYEEKDDAFKSYVQDSYESMKEQQAASTESGSALAASRESTLISFSTLFGDQQTAEDYLDQVKELADFTPFQFEDLTAMSKVLKTYKFGMDELIPTLTKIGDAGAANNMSTADMNTIATALGRMRSSGKVDLELMNQLQDRGINAIDYLAEAYGKSQTDIYDMISGGDFTGRSAEVVDIILNAMAEEFTGAMEEQSETFSGKMSTLEGLQKNLEVAKGEAYIQERMEGVQEGIDFLSGSMGERMEEAQRMIGQWEASLENQKDQIQRDMLSAVMGGDWGESLSDLDEEVAARLQTMSEQYAELQNSDAEDAGAQMGALLAEAKVMAQNEYMASEGYELQRQADLDLVASLRADTSIKDSYWNYGYELGLEFSKGRNTGAQQLSSKWYNAVEEKGLQSDRTPSWYNPDTFSPKAVGISYVPYDNYPALLHQGERVLTASEARGYSSGTGVMVSGNQFIVREEADINKIARELFRQMQIAQAAYHGG